MIYVCEFDHSTQPEWLQQLAEQLPVFPYDGPLEGVKWEKRRGSMLGWLLLQYALGDRRLNDMEIRRTKYGKPYSMLETDLHFNISHCDVACACVISSAPCGIDVEKKFLLRDRLVRKVCHPEEYAYLEQLSDQEKEQQFHFLWSMKESFVKMDGRGIGYGLERINLSPIFPVHSKEWQQLEQVSYFGEERETYTLAVCTAQQEKEPVLFIREKELLERIAGMEKKEI